MAEDNFAIEKPPPAEIIPPGAAPLQPRDVGAAPYRPGSYNYGYNYGPADDAAYFREMWRTVRKRKWLIIVTVTIATTLVTIQMFRTKPTYQAATTIEVAKESSSLRSGGVIINDDSDPFYQVNLKTKMLMLNSRELHEDVVVNLKLDENPKFVEPEKDNKSFWKMVRAIFVKDSPGAADSAGAADQTADPESSRSPEESKRLAPYVEALEDNLTIEPVRDTRALRVSFTHDNAVIASEVANGIARAFVQRNFQNQTEKFTNTASWLDSSTRELKAKVEQAEQALANYTRANDIFSINDDNKQTTTLTTEKLARLHDQLLRAETDRMLKETLYNEVKAGRIAQLPEAFADQNLVALLKQLNELRSQRAQLAVKFAAKNPKLVEVDQQIAAIEQQIADGRRALEEKMRSDFERAARDEQSLRSALEQTKKEAVQANQAGIQYNILKQDLDTARALYTDFLQKTNQAKAQVAEQHSNIRIIERATPPQRPIGPKRMLMIMLGFMVSLGASVGLVFLLEYLDNTIKNVEDVNRYVQLPALGVIPAIASSSPRLLASKNGSRKSLRGTNGAIAKKLAPMAPGQLMALDNRSSAAEAYRALRTSVMLSSAGHPPKLILVTSSQPGEGKTTTTINTAISLAQLGAKVLLIDCDLRKPTAHKVFGVDHTQGLSTYLVRDVPIQGLVQRLQIANLSLLPCGPIPPNPAELISSDRMKEMLASFAEEYDHILIDSPPLINVTDPVILSTMVDGVILVVHGGKSSRDVVRRSRQELTQVGAKIFGVVLNNVDLRREGYDEYYYYRYSYSYDGAAGEHSA